jgi:hypothetical protein
MASYICNSCVTQTTGEKGKSHKEVWPSSPANGLRHLDGIFPSRHHAQQQNRCLCCQQSHTHTQTQKRRKKERWFMNVRRVMILCVHSAVFSNIEVLKHRKWCQCTTSVDDTILLSVSMSCIMRTDHWPHFGYMVQLLQQFWQFHYSAPYVVHYCKLFTLLWKDQCQHSNHTATWTSVTVSKKQNCEGGRIVT